MKFNFLSKTLPAFGLDVSSNSFKVMELQSRGSSITVKGYHDTPLPKGMVINDLISDTKTFDFLIKQALHRPQYGQINTSYVVASLPESKSFVRVTQIPQMSDSEAESAVPFEAESFIPLPIDQVYLDWQKIGQSDDKMNILMVASPKDFVDKYLDILDKVGLTTVALEVESQSCLRAVAKQDNPETFLVVDLGAYKTSLIMVEDGNLQFTSTIPIAGNTFTESIARILGVSSTKAEEIKKRVGVANVVEYPNIKTSLLPVMNNLTEEIKNILKFHAEHSARQVSKIILLGGSARLKNLPEFLSSQLVDSGVAKVELANPWLNFSGQPEHGPEGLDALGFVTVAGLAMRGINYEIS